MSLVIAGETGRPCGACNERTGFGHACLWIVLDGKLIDGEDMGEVPLFFLLFVFSFSSFSIMLLKDQHYQFHLVQDK